MAVEVNYVADEHLRSSGGFAFPLVIPLIAVTVGLALLHFYLHFRRIAQFGNKIPGPPALPIIGNAHMVMNKTHNGKMLKNHILVPSFR